VARITLLTDFGTADGYAAAVKGVIATLRPDAIIDDAAHDIPAGNIHAGAWALDAYWRYYPAGTVHVVVVDPGVGGARRAIAAAVDGHFFVAPDNGVLTRVFDDAAGTGVVVEITDRTLWSDVVSNTFHGRDVFAPAAAHLARGGGLSQLGDVIGDPVCFTLPQPLTDDDGTVCGEVVHVDRYGNLITNIPQSLIGDAVLVQAAGRELALRRTYSDAGDSEPLALIGSRGLLELAVRDGRADEVLALATGAPVVVPGGRSTP
jgi:S-adenosyl-L-methionine hydrolase (adenosine-forming)